MNCEVVTGVRVGKGGWNTNTSECEILFNEALAEEVLFKYDGLVDGGGGEQRWDIRVT